ncbi:MULTISPECIES: DUF917 domain-containing protein [Chromobacterium]|uniref:DUF917 domain-containing protein n=1 Tax=Chromobacterium TaxID=535 RepID=UPI0018891042|nr:MULTISPECIES: DUF917 domain-containing protein [Chromobacterium]QOZ84714.1 DUF917 domain-containing protein [Chromobacterium sp. Rain0013]WON84899.1 DUF917 domain-containing protein [Chromobacterium haemolyticum]
MKNWILNEQDLDYIALGAAVLGTGGGGNSYLGKLRAREQLRAGRTIEVMSPDALNDEDAIICVAGIGAPTVGFEKIEEGQECLRAFRAVESESKIQARALMTDEIGGSNCFEPMIVAALTGLPVVDADGMGRAFPEMQMSTLAIAGCPVSPFALSDDKGNVVVFRHVISFHWLEKLARASTTAMGCSAGFALAPMTGLEIKNHGVHHTISQAWSLGKQISDARDNKIDPISALLAENNGRLLFKGKISDVSRATSNGFARGQVELDGLDGHSGLSMVIDFQNENLIARVNGEVVATVPDLICVLDSESGQPIATEEIRFGLRVSVIVLPASPLLRTPQALDVVGPRAFGYDMDYKPAADYIKPLRRHANPSQPERIAG